MRIFLVVALALLLAAPVLISSSMIAGRDVEVTAMPDGKSTGTYDPLTSLFENFTKSQIVDAKPRKVVTGFLNQDLRKDLAVIYFERTGVDIYYQSQDGTYPAEPSKKIVTSTVPTALDIGDMNNDGLTDVVIGYPSSPGKVEFFYQRADASSFTTSGYFSTSRVPIDLVTNDFDGDGYTDVAIVSANSTTTWARLYIHKNSTSFNVVTMTLYSMTRPAQVVKGDYDLDGKMDLAIVDRGANLVQVYRNTFLGADDDTPWSPSANLTLSQNLISSPVSIDFINGEGTGDTILAIACSGNNQVRMFKQNGGGFQLWKYIATEPGLAYAKGIFINNDGLEDMALVYDTSYKLAYYITPTGTSNYGSPSGTFPVQNGPRQLLAADLDLDGDEDLLIVQNRSAANGVLTVSYSVNAVLASSNDLLWGVTDQRSIFIGNLTGSSQAVGVLDRGNGRLYIYDSGAWHSISVPNTSDRAVALSLYSNAMSDVVVSDPVNNKVYILQSGSGIYSTSYIMITLDVPSPLTGPLGLDAIDENSDGLTDLVVACSNGIVIFYRSASGQGFSSSDNYVFVNGQYVGQWAIAGDFNKGVDGAGLPDLAVVNMTSNRIEVYFQQPSGPRYSADIGKMTTLAIPSGTVVWADSCDVDRNGLLDIVIGTSSGDLVAYRQYATGLDYSYLVSYASPHGFQTAAVGDYDDDGWDELAIVGSKVGSVSLVQFSSSTFKLDYVQTGGAGPNVVALGDIDGDKRVDIALGSPGSGSISIWYQRNLPPHASWSLVGGAITEGIAVTLDASSSWDSFSDNGSLMFYWKWRTSGGPWNNIPSTPSSPTVQYAFPSEGAYEVNMTVIDRSGASSWQIKELTVVDGTPTANFTWSGSLVEGSVITFQSTSTSPVDQIVKFTWDFGDGSAVTISTANVPVSHRYLWDGTFSVTLSVEDVDGDAHSMTKQLTVADSGPVFTVSYSPTGVTEGDTVSFTATVTSPDTVVRYLWSVQNDTVTIDGMGSSISHRFIRDGWYWVNLTVFENDADQNTVSLQVIVSDTLPSVSFTMSKSVVDEGEFITFLDTSYAYDGIASRYWTFGDGGFSTLQSPTYKYNAHGNFTITLWVRDGDGDNVSFSRTVKVNDTNPSAGNIISSGTTFNKGTDVTFSVNVTKGAETPTYLWNISGSSGSPVLIYTSTPSLSYKFTVPGTFFIVLTISDSDFSLQRSISITIVDQPPVPKVVVERVDVDAFKVTVSANTTQDIDDDIDGLEFRWNFGDGSPWTPWSSDNRYYTWTYARAGIYTIILQVKDPSSTRQTEIVVTLDKWPPEIILRDSREEAYVGDAVRIDVNVVDDIDFEVFLFYSYDGKNWSMVQMAPTDGAGNFSAQIPPMKKEGTMFYRIVATDINNNTKEIGPFEIKVVEEPSYFLLYLALSIIATVLAFFAIWLVRTRPVVDEVFVIYHDGSLIAHQARRMKPGMDDQILGSMFVALQGFVKDSFKDEASPMLKRMDFGDRTIMVEKGDFIYVAVVLNGKRTSSIPPRLQKVIEAIDERYGIDLIAWDGDLEKLRGIRDITAPLFKRNPFLDMAGRRRGKKSG
ncbi:MAG: PKD domain-containing protein [Methanomassiliicoccales archaeon]|nr:MAG: PKD domain-containing protein [Methanomassiliicoccales archaeon]